jgi:ELWxxDGT repeat protein
VGDTLYFNADDGVHGRELWVSHGGAGDTAQVRDMNVGAASADPSEFTAVGTTVFFNADDGVRGTELWATVELPYAVYLPLTSR